jgi:hypothetical protein
VNCLRNRSKTRISSGIDKPGFEPCLAEADTPGDAPRRFGATNPVSSCRRGSGFSRP